MNELFENLCCQQFRTVIVQRSQFHQHRSHMQTRKGNLKCKKVLAEENSSEDQDTATAQPGMHMNVLNMFTALVAILLR